MLGIVQISRPISAVVATIRPLLVSLAVAGLLALVVATLLGIGLSRRLVRPVHRLEEAALAMAGGDLQQQVPVETPDELASWRSPSTSWHARYASPLPNSEPLSPTPATSCARR